jgi:pilus assembly protein CpaF
VATIPTSILQMFEQWADVLAEPALRRLVAEPGGRVRVTRDGRVERLDRPLDEAALLTGLETLARRAHKVFDAQNPSLEAQLKDGTRFLALRPPAVEGGVAVTIVRPGGRSTDLDTLARQGSLTVEAARLLANAVVGGANLAVVGPADSGRTTLLEALCREMPMEAGLALVEEHTELRLSSHNVTRLSPRKADKDGGAVGVGDLMYFAARMGVDRLVLGDVRWTDACEAVHQLAARGVPILLSLPGLEAEDAVARLEALARASAAGPRERAVPGLLAAGLDLVVVLGRLEGARVVTRILQVDHGRPAFTWIPLFERSATPPRSLVAHPEAARVSETWAQRRPLHLGEGGATVVVSLPPRPEMPVPTFPPSPPMPISASAAHDVEQPQDPLRRLVLDLRTEAAEDAEVGEVAASLPAAAKPRPLPAEPAMTHPSIRLPERREDEDRTLVNDAVSTTTERDEPSPRVAGRSFSQVLAALGTQAGESAESGAAQSWESPPRPAPRARNPAEDTRETESPAAARRRTATAPFQDD